MALIAWMHWKYGQHVAAWRVMSITFRFLIVLEGLSQHTWGATNSRDAKPKSESDRHWRCLGLGWSSQIRHKHLLRHKHFEEEKGASIWTHKVLEKAVEPRTTSLKLFSLASHPVVPGLSRPSPGDFCFVYVLFPLPTPFSGCTNVLVTKWGEFLRNFCGKCAEICKVRSIHRTKKDCRNSAGKLWNLRWNFLTI